MACPRTCPQRVKLRNCYDMVLFSYTILFLACLYPPLSEPKDDISGNIRERTRVFIYGLSKTNSLLIIHRLERRFKSKGKRSAIQSCGFSLFVFPIPTAHQRHRRHCQKSLLTCPKSVKYRPIDTRCLRLFKFKRFFFKLS